MLSSRGRTTRPVRSVKGGWNNDHTYFFPLLLFPLDKWIVDERIENCHKTVAVLPEELERYLAGIPEHALDARDAKSIDDVLRQSKRHPFRRLEVLALYA